MAAAALGLYLAWFLRAFGLRTVAFVWNIPQGV